MAPDDDSPLAAAAGAAGPETTEAFELLANETRLAILLALWDAFDPPGSPTVSFSELRERVGMPDSGQFNYHLGKLEDRFVVSSEEGYRLHPVGNKIVRAVIGGVGLQTPSLDRTEIDMACPRCGASTAVMYEGGHLFQVCTECKGNMGETGDFPEGMLFGWRLEPAGLANRTAEEMYVASAVGNIQRLLAMIDGICPDCSAAVDSTLEICEDHGSEGGICPNCGRLYEASARFECTVCKFTTGGPPGSIVSQHPAVISFYSDHGVELQYDLDYERVKQLVTLVMDHGEEVVSVDPPEVRVTVGYEGDEISLLVDGDAKVIEVSD